MSPDVCVQAFAVHLHVCEGGGTHVCVCMRTRARVRTWKRLRLPPQRDERMHVCVWMWKRSRLPPRGGRRGRMCECACGSVRGSPPRRGEGTYVCLYMEAFAAPPNGDRRRTHVRVCMWKRLKLPPPGGRGRVCVYEEDFRGSPRQRWEGKHARELSVDALGKMC